MDAPFRFALAASGSVLFALVLWGAAYASPQSKNRIIAKSAVVDSPTLDEPGRTNGSDESTDDPVEPRVFRHARTCGRQEA